jgi:hypothetical protein
MVSTEPQQVTEPYPDDDYVQGQLLGGRLVAPWHAWLDETRFSAHLDQIASLPIEAIASCHAPALRGDRIARSFQLLPTLPGSDPWVPFTQADVDEWLTVLPARAGAAGSAAHNVGDR